MRTCFQCSADRRDRRKKHKSGACSQDNGSSYRRQSSDWGGADGARTGFTVATDDANRLGYDGRTTQQGSRHYTGAGVNNNPTVRHRQGPAPGVANVSSRSVQRVDTARCSAKSSHGPSADNSRRRSEQLRFHEVGRRGALRDDQLPRCSGIRCVIPQTPGCLTVTVTPFVPSVFAVLRRGCALVAASSNRPILPLCTVANQRRHPRPLRPAPAFKSPGTTSAHDIDRHPRHSAQAEDAHRHHHCGLCSLVAD